MIHNIVSYRIIPTYYYTYYMTHMYHRYKSLVFLGVLRFGTHVLMLDYRNGAHGCMIMPTYSILPKL
jgi:hypothetical protein